MSVLSKYNVDLVAFFHSNYESGVADESKMNTNPGVEGHYSLSYDVELENLRSKALEMGWLVEEQLESALNSLISLDQHIAKQVIVKEDLVNRMEVENDELCSQIIARRQPAASDLRFVISVIKTVNDLERIGDEIERVARIAMRICESETELLFEDIEMIGMHSRQMLSEALLAFSQSDVERAMEVIIDTEQGDKEYQNITRRTIKAMRRNVDTIPDAVQLLWVIRSLERIADRSCNICEYVIYFARGKDIRHSSLTNIRKVALTDNPDEAE